MYFAQRTYKNISLICDAERVCKPTCNRVPWQVFVLQNKIVCFRTIPIFWRADPQKRVNRLVYTGHKHTERCVEMWCGRNLAT